MELPQLIDPIECLKDQQVFEGSLDSNSLPRLSEVLSEANTAIPYRLTFSSDEAGRCIVHCLITTCLKLVCQRCTGSMDLPVKIDSSLCVIANDRQAEKLPKRYEPLVTEAGMVSPQDVVEEELLLAIPMIPRHSDADCPVNLSNELLN